MKMIVSGRFPGRNGQAQQHRTQGIAQDGSQHKRQHAGFKHPGLAEGSLK